MNQEIFTVSFGSMEIVVKSDLAGIQNLCGRLLSPFFSIVDGQVDYQWTIEVKIADVRLLQWREASLKSSPVRLALSVGGPDYVVCSYTDEEILLSTTFHSDGGLVAWSARPYDKNWCIYLESDDERCLRWVPRLLKLLFGTASQSNGVAFLHASGVSVDGQGILFLGEPGSGKSSLAYLASTLANAQFISDDTLVLDHYGQRLKARGWPKRIALGLSLLEQTRELDRLKEVELRRTKLGLSYSMPTVCPSDEWSRENRVAFDPDEFSTLFGIEFGRETAPCLLVIANADRHAEGWSLDCLTKDLAKEKITKSLSSTGDLRYCTDFLGTSLRRPIRNQTEFLNLLMRLPCVSVRFGPEILGQFDTFWEEIIHATTKPD